MIHIKTYTLKGLLWRAGVVVAAAVVAGAVLLRGTQPAAGADNAAAAAVVSATPVATAQLASGGGAATGAEGLVAWLGQTILSPGSLLSGGSPLLASGIAQASWQSDSIQGIEVDSGQDTDPDADVLFEIVGLQGEQYAAPNLAQGGQPQILIYHTHTREAYLQQGSYTYKEVGSWRTLEQDKSIVAVGEKLAALLTERGYNVLHDTTDHEPPLHTTAYTRSLETMEKYKEKYPSLTAFIDLHRDGVTPAQTDAERDTVTVDGQRVARMLCVVGTGDKYAEKPDWKANYKLAQAVTQSLQAVNKKLCKDVRVKAGRYNMHVSDSCLVMEVGHNDNTLAEALGALPYVAAAISDALGQPAA